MLIDTLKSDIVFATKSRNELASGLLKVVLAECQAKDKYDDDFIMRYCRKIIENNVETINHGGNSVKLNRENELLRSYLPTELTDEQISSFANDISDAIKAAKSEGQAIGILSKHIKSLGLSANGEILKNKVKLIRG